MECATLQKLHLDFRRPWRRGRAMDSETLDLVCKLCTRAGMMMEDASADAIILGNLGPEELSGVVVRLVAISKRISSTIEAAAALMG